MTYPWSIVSQKFLVSFRNIVAKITFLKYIFILQLSDPSLIFQCYWLLVLHKIRYFIFVFLVLSQVKSSTLKNESICHFLFHFFITPQTSWYSKIFCIYRYYNAHWIWICFNAASCTRLWTPQGHFQDCISSQSTLAMSLIEICWIKKCIIPWWVPSNIFILMML